MPRIVGLFLIATIIVLLPPFNATALTACTTQTAALDARETQMLSLINQVRAANGVQAIKPSLTLNRAAAWMAEWQSANMTLSHYDNATGVWRDPFVRMHDCGHPTYGNAEDVGGAIDDPVVMFNGWMSSPGHRAQILEPTWVTIGIGYAGGYWVLDFSAYDDSGIQPPAPVYRIVLPQIARAS